MKGIYVLLIEVDAPKEILIGKKRRFIFQKGFYGYVGSALSGLEKRLGRHLSSAKRLHWHIDHLLNTAKIRSIICAETGERKECLAARALSRRLPPVAGFGCSDCTCRSHLFFCQDLKALELSVFDALKSLELDPCVFV
jgi:Uri superfamily endonuclease